MGRRTPDDNGYLAAGPKADKSREAFKPLFSILLRVTERSWVGNTTNVFVPVFCHIFYVHLLESLNKGSYELDLRGIGGLWTVHRDEGD